MPQGYAGLSKSHTGSEALEANADTADQLRQLGTSRHANLHVVEVDRRSPARIDFTRYYRVPPAKRSFYCRFKRVFDVVGATFLILVLSPLILAIVACSYLSGTSPIFRHRRVGEGGKIFDCLKFQTMVRNAEEVLQNLLDADHQCKEEWLRDHKLKDDPRVTRLGYFLRRLSLDELPQLWNVIRGEMSLVGPRPVVPDELRRYGTKVSTYVSARPGITGLWQVSGRNDTSYRRRVALDVCYVRSQSIALDAYILVKTLPVIFARNGAY